MKWYVHVVTQHYFLYSLPNAPGLFSDTHILALMYAGEMCYWHHSLITQKKQKEHCSSRKAAAAGASATKSSSNTLRPEAALGLNHSAEGDVGAITRSASNLEIAGDDVWQARHPGNRHSIHVCEGAFPLRRREYREDDAGAVRQNRERPTEICWMGLLQGRRITASIRHPSLMFLCAYLGRFIYFLLHRNCTSAECFCVP